jgi:type II secretory pathway component PulM
MRRQQKEITDLRKAIGMRPARADLRALLAASAERAPFARSVERIDPASPGRVHFAAAPVDFDAWLEWIEALQREFGVRVESCRIAALGRPGLVRLEAVFATGGGAGAR